MSRLSVSAVLRLHVARCIGHRVGTDDDLLGLARRLSGDPAGVRCDPTYPGATAGVERVGDTTRVVLACVAFRHGEAVGIAFTTLIPGRAPRVSVAPLAARIPLHWRPLEQL